MKRQISSCPGGKYSAASPPTVLTLSGNLGAHDPAAYVIGKTIYLAATGLISKTGGGTLLVQGNAKLGRAGARFGDCLQQQGIQSVPRASGGPGTATLRIAEIVWDADGWPVTAGP